LSFAIFYLCKYPEYQNKVLEEVLRVKGDQKELNSDQIGQLTFTRQILNECLRLHPPVYEVDKENTKDTNLCGLYVPIGTTIGINILGLHTDPLIWKDPFRFDPNRWTEENLSKIADLRSSFIPFSIGTRDCIGKFFTYNEATIILAQIVSRYHLKLTNSDEILTPEMYITTKPKSFSIKITTRI
jgi:cytochrome P450